MSIYWVFTYFLRADRADEFESLVTSEEGKRLISGLESETGLKFVGMFSPTLGFGEQDVEEWWEAQDWRLSTR